MLPSQTEPLHQADLLRLDAFLHSPACGRDAMGLSRAHGFLTAAASGPEQLEPGEWLGLVFDNPVFEDGDQAREMLGLAVRLYQDIETRLNEPGGFRPVLDHVRDGVGGIRVDASAWCRGYFSAASLCWEHWSVGSGRTLTRLVAPIRALTEGGGRPDQCDALPGAAEAVYRYWRAQEPAGRE